MILLSLLLQITPVQPIVKGTGLPPPGTAEAAVMAPVNALFSALAARDPALGAAAMRADATATVASEEANGTSKITHHTRDEMLAGIKPGPERFEERLIDPAIEIDGDIAMVWGRYVFLIDGKISHCGVDHFDLVREGGTWKIQNITWSKRVTGC